MPDFFGLLFGFFERRKKNRKKRVVIRNYFGAYEIILPEKAKGFDEIWKQNVTVIQLSEREQGESVGYSPDGKSIFATSEKKNSPAIEVKQK